MRLIDADRFGMYLADLQLANRWWKDDFCDHLDDVMDALDEQPTIDPKDLLPHGRWIHNEYYESWAEKYVCSVCNHNAPSGGDYRHVMTNFCPNCGAIMDLEEQP